MSRYCHVLLLCAGSDRHGKGIQVGWTDVLRQIRRGTLAWLLGASLALTGTSLQAEDCAPPSARPAYGSNNRWIQPDDDSTNPHPAWPTPNALDTRGKFPCSRLFSWCDLDQVLRDAHVCALLVIKKGRLVHEYYEAANQNCNDGDEPVGNGPAKGYGLASIAKSVTATLLGHVLSDPARYGNVSFDDPVARHVGGLPPGTAIERVTLRQAATMTSALDYDENGDCLKKRTLDYAPPASQTLIEAVSRYSAGDPSAAPGRSFRYSGLDTALLGMAVEGVLARQPGGAPRHLDQALEDWVWKKAGMRSAARWKADSADTPIAPCCLYATARDLGRFGTTILAHWKAAHLAGATPFDRWVADASRVQVWPDHRACYVEQRRIRIGYGYQWWSLPDSEGFTALGVGGQFLHILPDQDTVIVQFGSWPAAPARARPV